MPRSARYGTRDGVRLESASRPLDASRVAGIVRRCNATRLRIRKPTPQAGMGTAAVVMSDPLLKDQAKMPVLFHISADAAITPHARSNSAILPAASAGARGRPCRSRASPRSTDCRVVGSSVRDDSARTNSVMTRRKCRSPSGMTRSRHSSLIHRTNRSA